jgi:hypothetical protein
MTTKASILYAQPRRNKAIELRSRLLHVQLEVKDLRARIDAIGEESQALGLGQPGQRDPDELGCYASNSLEGTLALLRELAEVLAAPARRRRGR